MSEDGTKLFMIIHLFSVAHLGVFCAYLSADSVSETQSTVT